MTRLRPPLAALGAALVVLTGLVATSTDASWTARQSASGALAAASADCTAPGLYTTAAAGRLLSGTLLGRPLDSLAGLPGVAVGNSGRTASPVPASATAVGQDAWRSRLTAAAMNDAVTAGASAALPLNGGTGVWTQVAAAHSTGASVGASGAVTDSGAIDSGGISDGTAASLGTLDLSAVLASAGASGALPAVSGLTASIGAVASRSSLDGCRAAWGGDGAQRGYRIGSLSLSLRDSALDASRARLTTASKSVADAETSLTGSPSSALSATESSLQQTAASKLGAVLLAAAPAGLVQPAITAAASTVTITGPDLGALAPVLAERLVDPSGLVAVDYGTGAITVDAAVLAPLNGRPPNSPVLDGAALAAVGRAVDAVNRTHLADLSAAWTAVPAGTTVSVTASAALTALVAGTTTRVAQVSATVDGTSAAFAGRTDRRSLPPVQILSTGLVDLSGLNAAVQRSAPAGFFAPVEDAVAAAVPTALAAAVTASSGTASDATDSCGTALPGDLAPIADVLSLTLNSEPDAAPHPPAWYGGDTADVVSVSALRVRLHTAAGDALDLAIANSSAGPDAPLQG